MCILRVLTVEADISWFCGTMYVFKTLQRWLDDYLQCFCLFFRRKLKQRLNIGRNVTIGYQIHKDTMVKAGSVTKNTYTV